MLQIHNLFYTLFIALTNNLDNIGVRVAYSIRGIRIAPLINGWISVITFVISFLAAYSGSILSQFLSRQWCSVIAMVLLTAIGSWMILEPYIRRIYLRASKSGQQTKETIFHVLLKPEIADRDKSNHIDFNEATLLGLALSINNVGGGVGAGIIGLNPLWVGILSAVLSFLALWAGNYIAEVFIRWNVTDKATVVAGLLLIAIGIKQIIK